MFCLWFKGAHGTFTMGVKDTWIVTYPLQPVRTDRGKRTQIRGLTDPPNTANDCPLRSELMGGAAREVSCTLLCRVRG